MTSWWPVTLTEWTQVIQVPIVAGGLGLVWWQIRQASRAMRLQALREVVTELGDVEMRKLRSEVLGRAVDDQSLEFKKRTVAVALDRVGYMSKHGLLPDTVFTDLLKGVIEDLWDKELKKTVDDVRKDMPGYCQCLKWLVEEKLPKIRARK